MAGPMRLMMAQIDDATGEIIGEFVRRAEALGARNVQIVPSITKKNRPAHIVYVDVEADLEAEVASLLCSELGAWGYRVLSAEHHHFRISRESITLNLVMDGLERQFPMRIKSISNGAETLRMKAEFDDLSAICKELREMKRQLPLMVLKAAIESQCCRANLQGKPLSLRF